MFSYYIIEVSTKKKEFRFRTFTSCHGNVDNVVQTVQSTVLYRFHKVYKLKLYLSQIITV